MAMKSKEEAMYRFRLAKGYIEEAERLFDTQLWRACVGSCQLAVENACKAVTALFRPIIRTHEVGKLLLDPSVTLPKVLPYRNINVATRKKLITRRK